MSTVLAVLRKHTGDGARKDRLEAARRAALICGIGIFLLSIPCALGFNAWAGFVPFAEGTSFLDLWDFLVSNCLLPLGSMLFVIFCVSKKHGWGWDNFMAEANSGRGMKVEQWMKPLFAVVVPIIIAVVFIFGMLNFSWR